jgi:hypothetical protein
MKRRIGKLFLVLLSSTFVVRGQNPPSPQMIPADTSNIVSDTMDVQHVLDAYHAAVLAHDGARLASLFLPQGSTWINVLLTKPTRVSKPNRPMRQGFASAVIQTLLSWYPLRRQASIRPTQT